MYTMSRFYFLKSKDQKLYKLCTQVEERVNDDADVFMLKCRRALECIVTVAGCNGRSLYEKVNDIKNNLQISKEMQHEIFALKDMCNENIHFEEKNRSEVDVAGTLAKLEHICHWLVDAIIDKQVQTVISDNVNVLKKKTRELEEAFKRNDFVAVARLSEEIKALSDKQRDDIHVIKSGSDLDADDRECCQSCSYKIGGICKNDKSAYYNHPCVDGNSRCIFYKRSLYNKRPMECCRFCYYKVGGKCKNKICVYYNLYTDFDFRCSFYKRNLSDKQRDDIHVIKSGSALNADELYKQAEQKYDEVEYEEAFKLFMMAAEKGHAGAQYMVGEAYYYAHGVEDDEEEAVKWYKLAAENGSEKAQEKLEILYKIIASDSYEKGKQKRDSRKYDEYYEKGKVQYLELNYKEAFKLFMIAAKNGHAGAQYVVGNAYFGGKGIEKNLEEAVKWYKLAAANGNEYAKNMLTYVSGIILIK